MAAVIANPPLVPGDSTRVVPAGPRHLVRPAHRALLSAHRAAAAQHGLIDNSTEALELAVTTAAEYVEFDVNITGDGVLVLHHDSRVRTPGGMRPITDLTFAELSSVLGRRPATYDDALTLLARAGKAAHVDLKFTSPSYADPLATVEADVAARALGALGDPELFIVTALEERAVHATQTWAAGRGVQPLVGLSICGFTQPDPAAAPHRIGFRPKDSSPTERFDRCGANLVPVNRHLADLSVLRWATKRGLPTLVWTVDDRRSLRRYLNDARVWMVTTNHPGRA